MPTPQKIYAGSTLIYESPITELPQQVDNTALVTVTGSTTAHTKGAWSELIASTTAQVDYIYFQGHTNSTNTVDTSMLFDIGTGAAGSETVRVADIAYGHQVNVGTTGKYQTTMLFPMRVASGTRIAVRLQSGTVASGPTARTASIRIGTMSGAARSSMPTTLDTMGANTGSTRGTTVGSNNTYVQVTSSTSQAYQALVLAVCGTGGTFTAGTSTFTVARGAAGSETDLFSVEAENNSLEWLRLGQTTQPFHTYTGHVPSGSRLSVKRSATLTTSDVILYGVPYA